MADACIPFAPVCLPYPIPEKELERLEALSALEILDTETEPGLDRIVSLAARLFDAPMAFICLVDTDREWFKAKYGSNVTQTPRANSFAAHSMLEMEPMVVCDATRDARFQNNPLVSGEMSIRFYVGAPIRTHERLPLGSLCVMDTVARQPPAQDLLGHLSDLAFLVGDQLDFRAAAAMKRDRTEQELRRSLLEKDTLLQEVHHRVKNNLQIVSSLLMLQVDSLADRSAVTALKECRQRVLSMAMIHERLYSGKQMAEIEFDEYARALVQELVHSYAGRKSKMTGRISAPRIRLNIGQAIPCGLILNELVTNALKYAYPEGRDGEVMVELHESPEGRIRVSVSDRGQGLPPDFDFRNSKTLGLRIVDVLAKQLGGAVTINGGERTTFVLDFPRDA